jgi:hypothetical protein
MAVYAADGEVGINVEPTKFTAPDAAVPSSGKAAGIEQPGENVDHANAPMVPAGSLQTLKILAALPRV